MKKLILLAFILSLPLLAQEKTHETSSEVPELSDFHDVIYPIWHTAWPEKDIKLLQSLLPDVEKNFSKIKNAELPGILRDKKMKWEDGISKFGVCVANYKKAALANDSTGLLNAAEKLHSQYEMLVRIIRPMLKEVDEFHQVLYMLNHYYAPEYNFVKIKEAAETLVVRMDGLNKAALPSRLQAKKENFDKSKNELAAAVMTLNDVVKKGDNKEDVVAAVDKVHSRYQNLEKVFD